LSADVGKSFVEKWKNTAGKDFKKQKEQVSLIPHSIIHFIQNKLGGGIH
jgi:hypothetical protein